MENATKALLIAAGVLIGMLILSLGVYLYYSIGVYVERAQEQIAIQELDKFNTQFYNYQAVENEIFSFQDVITAANLAYENNKKYDFPVAKFNSNLILDNKDNLKNAISEGNDNYVQVVLNKCIVGNENSKTEKKSVNLEMYVGNEIALAKILENNYNRQYKCNSVQTGKDSKRVYRLDFTRVE
mgnify:CR=1 FL=1